MFGLIFLPSSAIGACMYIEKDLHVSDTVEKQRTAEKMS
jgi:hypothetical protein